MLPNQQPSSPLKIKESFDAQPIALPSDPDSPCIMCIQYRGGGWGDFMSTVHTHIKETGFLQLQSEFFNKIHNFYQGKRHRLPWKDHFCLFEVSGFILAKMF